MASVPKPITLTQRAAVAGEIAPQPFEVVGTLPAGGVPAAATLTVIGGVKKGAAVTSPADDTADHAALVALIASLKASGAIA